jgi:hypothetical protein
MVTPNRDPALGTLQLTRHELRQMLPYFIGLPITYAHNGAQDHFDMTSDTPTCHESRAVFDKISNSHITKAVIGRITCAVQSPNGAIYIAFNISEKFKTNYGPVVDSGFLNGLSMSHSDTPDIGGTRLLPVEVSLVGMPRRNNCYVMMRSNTATPLISYMRNVESGKVRDTSERISKATSNIPIVMSATEAEEQASKMVVEEPPPAHPRGIKRKDANDVVAGLPDADRDVMSTAMNTMLSNMEKAKAREKAAMEQLSVLGDDKEVFMDVIREVMGKIGADNLLASRLNTESTVTNMMKQDGMGQHQTRKLLECCSSTISTLQRELKEVKSSGRSLPPATYTAPQFETASTTVTSSSHSMPDTWRNSSGISDDTFDSATSDSVWRPMPGY